MRSRGCSPDTTRLGATTADVTGHPAVIEGCVAARASNARQGRPGWLAGNTGKSSIDGGWSRFAPVRRGGGGRGPAGSGGYTLGFANHAKLGAGAKAAIEMNASW